MTINIGGKLLNLTTPKIMGILNITPDSFFDGGKYNSEKEILCQVEKMINEGSDIIDVGGYSSRPGAKEVKLSDEIERVIPVIKLIKKEFDKTIVSIDTFRSQVAKKAVNLGASIVNDISGGEIDSNMYKCVSELKVPYIIMHMKGNPSNMQNQPTYKNVVNEVVTNLSKKIFLARQNGIMDIIIDPGFGFGKTLNHNYEILNNLEHFKELDCPILVGVSRKSMIYKPLEIEPNKALNGTTCIHTISILSGANILRVHDVKEAKEVVKLTNILKGNT